MSGLERKFEKMRNRLRRESSWKPRHRIIEVTPSGMRMKLCQLGACTREDRNHGMDLSPSLGAGSFRVVNHQGGASYCILVSRPSLRLEVLSRTAGQAVTPLSNSQHGSTDVQPGGFR